MSRRRSRRSAAPGTRARAGRGDGKPRPAVSPNGDASPLFDRLLAGLGDLGRVLERILQGGERGGALARALACRLRRRPAGPALVVDRDRHRLVRELLAGHVILALVRRRQQAARRAERRANDTPSHQNRGPHGTTLTPHPTTLVMLWRW